jgi:hypothetical protein
MFRVALAAARVVGIVMLTAVLIDRTGVPAAGGNAVLEAHDAEFAGHGSVSSFAEFGYSMSVAKSRSHTKGCAERGNDGKSMLFGVFRWIG